MSFTVLEFNKSGSTSLDEFSDLIQKTINENNDLVLFRAYENLYSNAIAVELVFGSSKTKQFEVMAFGPYRSDQVSEEINGTLKVAGDQNKSVAFAGMVTMSKSPRAVGFLVLEKGTVEQKVESSAERKGEAQTGKQDTKANARTNRRTKGAV